MNILALDLGMRCGDGVLSAFVPGRPAPQGSKRYLGRGVMIESSKAVKPWRADVRAALLDDAGRPRAYFDGPVAVTLEFIMPRPAATPKKRTPPAVKKPDIDKLGRAILDAIGSAGVWNDDAQVVAMIVSKRLAATDEQPGAHIHVGEWRERENAA